MQYAEGTIADGPNGATLVFRGGQWVPMTSPAIGGPITIGTPDPYAQPKDAASLESTRASTARTQQQIALDAATTPATISKLNAETAKAQVDAEKARRDLAAGTPQQREVNDRLGRIRSLAGQINRVEDLFNAGPGATGGMSGLLDYLPSDANARFDTAGASLAQQGLAAFRVPGTGTVSDRDATMFDRANLPEASNRDVANEEILRGLRGRVDEELRTLGQRPYNWVSGEANRTVATGTTKDVEDPGRAAGVAALQSLLRSGAPDDQVRAAAAGLGASDASVGAALEFRRKNPGYTGAYDLGDLKYRTEATTAFERAAGSPAGTFLASAGNAIVPFGALPFAADDINDRLAAVQDVNPRAGLAGTLFGGVLGAAGAELGAGRLLGAVAAPRVADAAYGGLQGYGAADEGEGGTGAVTGALSGLVGGMAGRAVMRGAGNAARGVRDEGVRYLRDRNVPLTVGQTLGGVTKEVEDRLSGLPVIGGVINNRRREGVQAFNRAAFDEALAPINASTGGRIEAQGVEAARAARSQAYSDALDPVTVQADAPFQADMLGTIAAGRALPEPMRGNMDYTLPTRVGESFDNAGNLTGRDFQQAIRGLRRDAKAVEALPYGHDFGQVTRQAESGLEGLLERQSPGTLPAYRAANEANRNVEVIRDAVNAARNGTRSHQTDVFMPSQLSDAAARSAKRFGNSQGTTRQPFYDLTRAGQDVLPSDVPDSGTAGRLVTAQLAGLAGLGGAGAGAGYVAGDAQGGAATGLGLGALLALGGSRGSQRVLTSLLADRPDLAVRIGEQLNRRANIGGWIGTSGAVAAQKRLAGP